MNSTAISRKPTYPGFGIDFITREESEDGTHVAKWTNFDVYKEDYEHGVQTGTRMVFQVMAALEKMPDNGTPNGLARSLIEEAARLSETEREDKDLSLRGAAVGVLITFDELLMEVARSGMWRAAMVKSLTTEMDYVQSEHNSYVEQTMTFMEKLGAPSTAPVEAPIPIKTKSRKVVAV